MYQGTVKRVYLGNCIYCNCPIYQDEEGEIIYTGPKVCNCTIALKNNDEDDDKITNR